MNTLKHKKHFFLSLWMVAVLLVMISCDRTENLTFEDFDNDNSGVIEKNEFHKTFTKNFYDDWNQNDDPYLDDEDFYMTVYDVWDVDNDMALSYEEWLRGYDFYYGDFIVTDYESIDIDGDGLIEYEEYEGILDDTDFYVTWDVDASEYLSEEELASGVFHRWDIDNSGAIERDEYTDFDRNYLDI